MASYYSYSLIMIFLDWRFHIDSHPFLIGFFVDFVSPNFITRGTGLNVFHRLFVFVYRMSHMMECHAIKRKPHATSSNIRSRRVDDVNAWLSRIGPVHTSRQKLFATRPKRTNTTILLDGDSSDSASVGVICRRWTSKELEICTSAPLIQYNIQDIQPISFSLTASGTVRIADGLMQMHISKAVSDFHTD